LGLVVVQQGAYSQAEAYYQEALAQARRIGHRAHICKILANLGDLCELRGDYVQAERYCQEGVELARQIGLRYSLAALLLHLGFAIGQQGDTYQRANACFQECLEIAQQLRHGGGLSLPALRLSRLISTMYLLWGEIHFKYQNLDAAASAFGEVLRSTDESEQEQYEQGESGLGQAVALTAVMELDCGLKALALYGLARIAGIRGRTADARRLGRECTTILESLGHNKAREVRQWLTTISASDQQEEWDNYMLKEP
jgi:tetratricopeptide (TPR) repeat protein